jgi:putative tricarboxylic transport membrane protein
METAKKTDALPFKQQLAGFLPTFILLVLYVFLLRPIGFLIMTALYIYLQSWLITPADKRKPVKLAVISGGTSVVIYGVFVFGLNLMLPAGILG